MTTYISKDARGNWSAVDEIALGDNLVLTIRTSKNYSSNLNTYASVGRKDGNFISHVVYRDFSTCIFSRHPTRITSKVVEAQHAEALAMLDSIKDRIDAHYSVSVA